MMKYAYESNNSGRLLTKWHHRKAEATKEVNTFIGNWLGIDLSRPDAKFWIETWREEDTKLITDELAE